MRKSVSLTTLALALFFTMQICQANSNSPNNIYRIEALNCGNDEKDNFVQTGFADIIEKHKVVITALHGVISCNTINVKNAYGEEFIDLKIFKINIRKDLVALTSRGLLIDHDFKPVKKGNFDFSQTNRKKIDLRVIGYPHSTSKDFTYDISSQGYLKLKKFLPLGGRAHHFLAKRRSPDININIIGLDGPMQPGLSGAPVFSVATNRVIGVVNGGLQTAEHFDWAIPYDQIRWQSLNTESIKNSILKLRNTPSKPLFNSLVGKGNTDLDRMIRNAAEQAASKAVEKVTERNRAHSLKNQKQPTSSPNNDLDTNAMADAMSKLFLDPIEY